MRSEVGGASSLRMRSVINRPYLFAVLGVCLVVALAWTTRTLRQPVGPGSAAPSFAALTLTGDTVRLEDYAGNVILLNIWATWCPPCREEMPSMERLYRHFKEQQASFEILAVSIDALEGQADVQGKMGGDLAAFAEEYRLTFVILHDPSGKIQETYQTTGIPESFLIGKDGIIGRRVAGPADWDSPGYREFINRLLAGESPQGK